ncbi:MAG TPA: hypothetical protein VFE05_01670 [Longimicrobiaceae bacterium]|nr:hypothetical protein [Longimicrobiaceae bacterium]
MAVRFLQQVSADPKGKVDLQVCSEHFKTYMGSYRDRDFVANLASALTDGVVRVIDLPAELRPDEHRTDFIFAKKSPLRKRYEAPVKFWNEAAATRTLADMAKVPSGMKKLVAAAQAISIGHLGGSTLIRELAKRLVRGEISLMKVHQLPVATFGVHTAQASVLGASYSPDVSQHVGELAGIGAAVGAAIGGFIGGAGGGAGGAIVCAPGGPAAIVCGVGGASAGVAEGAAAGGAIGGAVGAGIGALLNAGHGTGGGGNGDDEDPELNKWAKRLGLNKASKNTQELFRNRLTKVADYINKFRKGSIRREIPTDYLKKTVDEALREGGSKVRKLLTDKRFLK